MIPFTFLQTVAIGMFEVHGMETAHLPVRCFLFSRMLVFCNACVMFLAFQFKLTVLQVCLD